MAAEAPLTEAQLEMSDAAPWVRVTAPLAERIRDIAEAVWLRRLNPRAVHVIGNSGSSSSRRVHKCNACGAVVATSAQAYRPTVAALDAEAAHLLSHEGEVAPYLAVAAMLEAVRPASLSSGTAHDVARWYWKTLRSAPAPIRELAQQALAEQEAASVLGDWLLEHGGGQ